MKFGFELKDVKVRKANNELNLGAIALNVEMGVEEFLEVTRQEPELVKLVMEMASKINQEDRKARREDRQADAEDEERRAERREKEREAERAHEIQMQELRNQHLQMSISGYRTGDDEE